MENQGKDIKWLEILAKKNIDIRIRAASEISYMPGGQNGPYFDIETPVRNTAHWLIILAVLYKETQEPEYKRVGLEFLNFLLNPGKYTWKDIFIHRQKSGKDWCNGVIGQAWVVEALNIASDVFGKQEAKEAALKYTKVFRFETGVGAWSKTDPRNTKIAVDYTLNHQLWYAAAILETCEEKVYNELDHFLNILDKGAFRVREDGLICHLFYSNSFKGAVLRSRYTIMEKRNMKLVREKEAGYHLFNLYPLARIYRKLPDHAFFRNASFAKAVTFSSSEKFIDLQDNNKYAYPYNSPAFELPLVVGVFKSYFDKDTMERLTMRLLDNQMGISFDAETGMFSRNTKDPLTLTSRAYEWALSRYYISE